MVKYFLKSGKDTFQVEQAEGQTFEDFQAKVFALTDIPPKNLKILFKAKMIKDNPSLLALPAQTALIIMGTKAGKELKQSGEAKIQTKMQAQDDGKIPQRYGLVNVGNTCYMNAALQLLRNIPQLNQLLRKYIPTSHQVIEQVITKAVSSTFHSLQSKDYTPQYFVGVFLQSHPDYLPLGTQHDSDQFMQELLSIFSRASPALDKSVKALFQIEFVQVTKNTEIQEQPKLQINTSTKLCCSIGGVEKDLKIGTLNESIKLSLDTKIQKKSHIDDLNHIYEKKIRFNSLPPYLLAQMVRFFWKKAEDLPHSKPTAVKICKSINFSNRIDVFDYCSQQLKEKLIKGREALEQNRKNEQLEYKKQYEEYKESIGNSSRPEKRIIQQFNEKWKRGLKPIKEGLETGYYELVGTVTHLGNSVQSGHYMAWIKQNDEDWTKYDDNTVYQQPSQKVNQLRGGQPNLEIAYVLLFKKVFAKPL